MVDWAPTLIAACVPTLLVGFGWLIKTSLKAFAKVETRLGRLEDHMICLEQELHRISPIGP